MEAAGQDKVVGGSEKSKILPYWDCLLPHTFFKGKNLDKFIIALFFSTYRNTFKSMLLLTVMVRCYMNDLNINLRVSGRGQLYLLSPSYCVLNANCDL